MTLLVDMIQFLADEGHGSITGSLPSIRALWLPDKPDDVVALFDYPGTAPQHVEGGGTAWQNPRLQVLVRDLDPQQAGERAQAVHDTLDAVLAQTIGTGFYLAIEAQQSPGFLQRDEANRTIYVCNFAVMLG